MLLDVDSGGLGGNGDLEGVVGDGDGVGVESVGEFVAVGEVELGCGECETSAVGCPVEDDHCGLGRVGAGEDKQVFFGLDGFAKCSSTEDFVLLSGLTEFLHECQGLGLEGGELVTKSHHPAIVGISSSGKTDLIAVINQRNTGERIDIGKGQLEFVIR